MQDKRKAGLATRFCPIVSALSQISAPVATIRRKYGENLWNLPEIVVSLQCQSEQTTSERQYV
jgi:hypothetical protein